MDGDLPAPAITGETGKYDRIHENTYEYIVPVPFDEYDASAEVDRAPVREGSNGHLVLAFLLASPEKGFTPREIADATGIPSGSIGPTLQRLESRGLVRHKEPYWSAARDERIASYEAMLASMESIGPEDGWEDVDAAEHKVDADELRALRARREDEQSADSDA